MFCCNVMFACMYACTWLMHVSSYVGTSVHTIVCMLADKELGKQAGMYVGR